jgi:hypothetical protein
VISCPSQVAVLARAINSNVVKRDWTGGGLPWPDGPKGGPRHNSTEANVVFRGKPAGLYMRTRALPWMGLPRAHRRQPRCMYVWMGAGTGFRDDAAARAFFAVGRQYRARGFVATSYNKYTAQDFIKRVRSHLRPLPLTPAPT